MSKEIDGLKVHIEAREKVATRRIVEVKTVAGEYTRIFLDDGSELAGLYELTLTDRAGSAAVEIKAVLGSRGH